MTPLYTSKNACSIGEWSVETSCKNVQSCARLKCCPSGKTFSCDWQKGWFSRDFWQTLVMQLCNYITHSVVSAIYKGSSLADQRVVNCVGFTTNTCGSSFWYREVVP